MNLQDDSMGDIPTRPMRVKILYTFDHDNKTNCLARVPDVLQIPAVAIDENNQVGVIELQQCLGAVVTASPELVSRLSDGDFTIYAYDYSEQDTPLVGQGMLSTALGAAESNTQGKTMITGRVCKNMLALFNSGVKETLEVKLRLVPVARPSQSGMAKAMEPFASLSPAVSSGFDPNAWSMASQQSRSQQPTGDYFGLAGFTDGGEKELALMEDMLGLGSGSSGSHGGSQMGGGVGMLETPSATNFGTDPAFAAHPHSAPGSRAGTPVISLDSSSHNDQLRHHSFSANSPLFHPDLSRPDSRASTRSELKPSNLQHQHQRQASAPSPSHQSTQPSTDNYYNDDGQSRKRVKVTQTDWHGRSSFGTKSSDLRVTASTAASMHMHRPIPKRPTAPGSNLEPPPRVPTPVPDMNPLRPQQQQMAAPRRSLLRQASTANSDFMSDAEYYSDAIMSSPEEESPSNSITAEGTPQEIPSSPPVFPDLQLPQPSSPGLPTMPPPRVADSGYMSERGWHSSNPVESVEEGGAADGRDSGLGVGHRKPRPRSMSKREKTQTPAFTSDMNINLETPGDMNQLPQRMLLNLPPGRREGSQGPRSTTSKKALKSAQSAGSPVDEAPIPSELSSRVGSPAPSIAQPSQQVQAGPIINYPPQQIPIKTEAAGSRRGSLALPSKPSMPSSDLPEPQNPSNNPTKRRQTLVRCRTSSNESEAGSPAPSDTEGRPRGPSRSGSGAQRRKAIEQKLQKSIQNGVMPTFCSHCGAIETPTWRRLYAKIFEGKPCGLDYQEGEGETVGVESVTDDSGEVTSFIVRKAMKKTKDSQPGPGFKEVVVCNPCGLWFNKFRSMRPPDKWHRKVGSRKSKKTKENEADLMTDGLEPQSDMLFTDQIMPESVIDDIDAGADEPVDSNPALPTNRTDRANSMQLPQPRRANSQEALNASQLDAALTRAVQSSPARFSGSQESPINIDELSAKPTRRLLFPSPRRDGEVKSLDNNYQASLNATTPSKTSGLQKAFISPKMGFGFDHSDSNIFDAFTSLDKENMAPDLGFDDYGDLEQFMGGSPSALFRTPRKSASKPATTPKSSRQRQSKQLQKTPVTGSRKRKALVENPNAANNATNYNDFMTSPSSSRYFLRSTPSRLERTPGRTSSQRQDVHSNDMTPWSRQIAQMLSGTGEGETFTSPSRAFDFSGLPSFGTPGRTTLDDCDWGSLEEIMSSEFAVFSNQDSDVNPGRPTANKSE